MADADSQHAGSDDDYGADDAVDSGDNDVVPVKRGRFGVSRGRQPVIPADVVDAMIMLRIEKEKAFLQASDGRTRNTGRSLWIAIATELKEMFGGRHDVNDTFFNHRALGKKWSYIETTFKVSAFDVRAIADPASHHHFQRYLASQKPSGGGRKQPPSFAQDREIHDALMEYFHGDRPDVVPPVTLDSLAGLAAAPPVTFGIDDPTHSSQSTSSPPHPTPAAASERKPGAPVRKHTAMSMLSTIADSKGKHTRDIGSMVKAVTTLVNQRSGETLAVPPDTRRSMASMLLSRLEIDEGVCDDEEAMGVVEEAARVLHGAAQGPAERMASRLCVMAEQGLPPGECVAKLRMFLRRDAAGSSTTTVGTVPVRAVGRAEE